MNEEVLKIAATQGIWAALFVILLYYILKNQEKRDLRQEEREKKYQELLQTLVENFQIVKDIRGDVTEIKDQIKNQPGC